MRYNSKLKRSAAKGNILSRIFLTHENCLYCHVKLTNDPRFVCDFSVTIDHFVPKKNKGGNRGSNLVAACWLCNNIKSDANSIDFGMFALWHLRPHRGNLLDLAIHLSKKDIPQANLVFSLATKSRIISINDQSLNKQDCELIVDDFLRCA